MLKGSGVLEAWPTVVLTNHRRPINVPRVTADATASAGPEGSAATDTNSTGDDITLNAYRYDGRFTVSIELLMASEINLEELLTDLASRAIANQVAAQLALGDGTTEPAGVFTSGVVTTGVTAAAETSITVDEAMECCTTALPKGYRKQAKVVSDELFTSLLTARDDNGQFMLRTLDGGGSTFCGKPMFQEPAADQTSISTGEIHLVAGDFERGLLFRSTPMLFKRTDGDDPPNPVFHFAAWVDSAIADTAALRCVVTA